MKLSKETKAAIKNVRANARSIMALCSEFDRLGEYENVISAQIATVTAALAALQASARRDRLSPKE